MKQFNSTQFSQVVENYTSQMDNAKTSAEFNFYRDKLHVYIEKNLKYIETLKFENKPK